MRAVDATSLAMQERGIKLADAIKRTLQIMGPKQWLASPGDFSLERAIKLSAGLISPREAPVEATARDIQKDAGYVPSTPHSILVSSRILLHHMGVRSQDYQVSVSGSGAELVETTMAGDQFIDALRPRSVVLQLGAQVIGGLTGNVELPRLDTTSTGYWIAPSGSPVLSGAITESEGNFDSAAYVIKPCQIGTLSLASRLMMRQGGELADFAISNNIVRGIATGFDAAALAGSGASGSPTGVINTTGVGAVNGTNFSQSTAVSAVGLLTTQDAVINRTTLGWAVNATTAETLAGRPKIAGYPTYVMDPNCDSGVINGHKALATNNVPSGSAIFGDWSQLLLLRWGAAGDAPIEIELSHFGNGFSNGDIQLRAILAMNVAVRHAQSFTVVTGIT